jgi:hypothetical protein
VAPPLAAFPTPGDAPKEAVPTAPAPLAAPPTEALLAAPAPSFLDPAEAPARMPSESVAVLEVRPEDVAGLPRRRRSPLVLAALGVIVLALLIGVAVSLLRTGDEASPTEPVEASTAATATTKVLPGETDDATHVAPGASAEPGRPKAGDELVDDTVDEQPLEPTSPGAAKATSGAKPEHSDGSRAPTKPQEGKAFRPSGI